MDQKELAKALLSPKEQEALAKVVSDPTKRLAPTVAAQLFGLYLQGYDTDALVQQNPNFGSLGLGLIVRAKVEYNWDEEKDKYIQGLMANVRDKVTKITLEGVQFVSDGMATFHKLAGNKMKKYLQTGDESELGIFREMSFKNYKDFVELLHNLTGQGNEPQRTEVLVRNAGPAHIEKTVESNPVAIPTDRPITAGEASDLLSLLVSKKKS